jgi:hypothetical protein
MRAATLALIALVALACGKYGPPVRAHEARAKAAPAAAAPATSSSEQCDDPNAAAAAQVKP